MAPRTRIDVTTDPPPTTPPQVSEFHATRDQDEREFNLNLGTRVFVHVRPQAMMGFNYEEIDSSPITK